MWKATLVTNIKGLIHRLWVTAPAKCKWNAQACLIKIHQWLGGERGCLCESAATHIQQRPWNTNLKWLEGNCKGGLDGVPLGSAETPLISDFNWGCDPPAAVISVCVCVTVIQNDQYTVVNTPTHTLMLFLSIYNYVAQFNCSPVVPSDCFSSPLRVDGASLWERTLSPLLHLRQPFYININMMQTNNNLRSERRKRNMSWSCFDYCSRWIWASFTFSSRAWNRSAESCSQWPGKPIEKHFFSYRFSPILAVML